MDRLLCDVRCDAGLSRLEYSEKLTEAAKAHAHDLATNIGVLQHEGSDGSTVAERVTRTGYEWQKVAENIAVGYTTTSAVMDGWMNSPPHRANNLLPGLTHFGAAAEGDDKYWVLVLAEEK
ncbi:MAG: serine protease [Rhodobacterales bacterium]|nr:MAG: serine protease [Rhodobacterales bacterium]